MGCSHGYLVGGLEHFDYFSISWECHHPNWRTHIFQRGRLKPPTRYGWNSSVWSVAFSQRFSAEVFPDSRRRTGISNRESSPTTPLKIWEMMINQWMCWIMKVSRFPKTTTGFCLKIWRKGWVSSKIWGGESSLLWGNVRWLSGFGRDAALIRTSLRRN